jgi:hypothetical protein
MATLKEHIEFLQKLGIPYKATLIRYLHNVFNEHLSGDKGNELADTMGNRMTLNQFVEAIIKPEAKQ